MWGYAPLVSQCLSFAVIKYPGKNNLREEGSVWAQSSRVRSLQLEVEAASHIAPAVRGVINEAFSLLCTLRSPSGEGCHCQWVGLSTPIGLIEWIPTSVSHLLSVSESPQVDSWVNCHTANRRLQLTAFLSSREQFLLYALRDRYIGGTILLQNIYFT